VSLRTAGVVIEELSDVIERPMIDPDADHVAPAATL
jgi:hypothetical protein